MGAPAEYEIAVMNALYVVIRDLGPRNRCFTVTNDASGVVQRLAPILRGRRLLYFDSEGELDELLVKDGKFVGFATGVGARQQ